VSLRPDSVFGDAATTEGRLIASSAFVELVNAFFISLLALIPNVNRGIGAGIVSLISLSSTSSTHRAIKWDEPGWRLLGLALLAYTAQIGFGVALTINPHAAWAVNATAYIMIGSFSVALGRAWALVEGDHLKTRDKKPDG
jgi:hypothetical protein